MSLYHDAMCTHGNSPMGTSTHPSRGALVSNEPLGHSSFVCCATRFVPFGREGCCQALRIAAWHPGSVFARVKYRGNEPHSKASCGRQG